jgi:hypothetical protein
MTRLLRSALVVAAVLSLVAVAGCGGDTASKNDYVDALNKVQTDFKDSVTKSGSAGSATEAKDVFANLSTAIDKLIADLKGVEAPDEVKDLHNDLITEMTEFKSQVEDAGSSLASGDPKAIVAAQTKFATEASQLATKIGTTITDINKELQD